MQRGTKAVVFLAAAAALGLPGAVRADYYSYTKENGSTGYADELRQVPARYRDSAERHADKPLAEYPRLTESEPVRSAPAAGEKQLCSEEPRGARTIRSGKLVDEISEGREGRVLLIEAAPEVIVPVIEDDEQPVLVDRHVPRWSDGRYRYYTIVRRGDRVISEIEER
jgi:hypothetical protein